MVTPNNTTITWTWRDFGGRLMLVTDTGGSKVILAADRGTNILTRDPKLGLMRPLKAEDEVARLIAAAPTMIAELIWLYQKYGHQSTRDVLTRAGWLP